MFWQKLHTELLRLLHLDMVMHKVLKCFYLVAIDCMTSIVICTGLVEHWYSRGCLRTASLHYLSKHCKPYDMEADPRQKLQAESFVKTFSFILFCYRTTSIR